ncbi:MAG: replicative DNA helicase [Geminicoccaceae bacterium]|nr:replicative DNA helicase [Geminicoccaceae bacterium]MCS7268808.1 replicative DNA helicase [Geminicoccaceae bacterium]MDW8124644.1 replicative DNA helicase [Geminicoccaceae bacterium]MDW8342545.1 replicative DNA helicase [Geminicoccaceae bacterium]
MTTTETLRKPAWGPATDPPVRVQPFNLEAEQTVLGAILVNNEAYNRVEDFLSAEDFYEPVHQRIFAACAQWIAEGRIADHKTLFHLFDSDPALKELDGARYLARLAAAAETVVDVVHYARVVHDLALRRRLIRVGEDVVNRAFDPAEPRSAREQIEQAEQELFALAETGRTGKSFRPFPSVLAAAIRHVESAYHKAGRVTGVPTRLEALDQKLGGLQPSDLIVLAGRPSMGKTALGLTIAANAASTPLPPEQRRPGGPTHHVVGLFSLEMSAEQLALRLLSAEARIPSDELRRGQLGAEDWPRLVRASQKLAEMSLFIDDTPALSVASLRTRARRLKRTHGLSLVVVDYLQLLRGTGSYGPGNRVQEVSEITQGLKALAKELEVPVLALSQLSRAVESRDDKRPMLSDLRESGSIEQDADVVMFVFREEYYLSRAVPTQREGESAEKFQQRYQEWVQRCEKVHNKAEIIIAKQRNGPIGNVFLQFDAAFGRFRNLESDTYLEGYY